MYNHKKQYRCSIIRGKSQKEIDDLLPAYAKIITDICPCTKESFEHDFNASFAAYIPADSTKKTFDNHRTEIAGKLFGMYYIAPHDDDSEEAYVYPAERTMKFMEDNDQPAFFKDICFKMQFPNGMTKIETVKDRIKHGISIRPNAYVLKVLLLANNDVIFLIISVLGYYVLNSLDALTRTATPLEVVDLIEQDKKAGIVRKVHTDGKASSYDVQHINEQINYLELANLVITNGDAEVAVNANDMDSVTLFADLWNEKPLFDCATYNLADLTGRKQFQLDWDYYFSQLSVVADKFATTSASLGIIEHKAAAKPTTGAGKIELGDEGEFYVLDYEKERVKAFDPRLVGKVIHLGKTRGLGYDIQSVIAEKGDMAEFVKYIEVKSTKRVTEPDLADTMWVDTLNITRNEWIAALQHKDFYSIFRVYFVRGNIIMYVIKDLYQKEKDGKIKVVPLTYRVDFGGTAIDEIIPQKAKVV